MTPPTSNMATGLPSLATMFAASSANRTFPSWSGSLRLKKMSAPMPPSTPTEATPSDRAAPTAISAPKLTSSRSAPVAGSRSFRKKPFSRYAGLSVAENCEIPSVS